MEIRVVCLARGLHLDLSLKLWVSGLEISENENHCSIQKCDTNLMNIMPWHGGPFWKSGLD